MKTDLRYAASDCFDTFPFPLPDPLEAIPSVEAAGKAFYEARARLMLDTEQGLTKTYNALRDPENSAPAVAELRRLTEAMDRAVLDAYGWTYIPVPPYCPRTDAEGAAVQAFEHEVIDRLYVLNAERAAEEERLGLAKGKGKKGRAHRATLIAYLEQHQDLMDEEARRRMYSNPLRVLDTKNPAMQDMVNAAPRLIDFLGEASLRHFDTVKAILDANGVAWSINPRLVRGMDYYNLTVFEFITEQLGSQGTICGGGRYDYLIEQIGGKNAPAVGWALGVERVLELLKEQAAQAPQPAADAYAVVPDVAALPQVMVCLQQLRALGVAVQMHSPANSAKQFANLDFVTATK